MRPEWTASRCCPDNRRCSKSTARRPRLFALLALALILTAFPLGALASHDFADVPDSNPFRADISALAESDVTTGCGRGNFCPGAFVTREQMAAFMNRLGALAEGKQPVVNADRLDGYHAGDLTRVAVDSSSESVILDGDSVTAAPAFSVPIFAPTDGYLVMTGSSEGWLEDPYTDDSVTCSLRLEGIEVTGGGTDILLSAANPQEDCTVVGAQVVCAGAYTVDLYMSSIGPDTNFGIGSLVVQFVPFGLGGEVPVIACISG